jgi:hypothetical protein
MTKLLLACVARLPIFAVALVLAAPGAHAFTFGDQTTTNSGGSSLVDPDEQVKNFGSGGTSSQDSSSPGFHFSTGPSFGSGLTNQLQSPPAWVGNPLFLDKGPSQRDQ